MDILISSLSLSLFSLSISLSLSVVIFRRYNEPPLQLPGLKIFLKYRGYKASSQVIISVGEEEIELEKEVERESTVRQKIKEEQNIVHSLHFPRIKICQTLGSGHW